MSDKHKPGGPDDRLFTISEAQQFLRIGRSAMFELLRVGTVPYVRKGSRRFCWRSDLVRYLNANRVAGADAA